MQPVISPKVRACIETLLANPAFQQALSYLEADEENKIAELKEMVVIPGVSFLEHETRSPMYKQKLEQYGATDCFIDEVGNAYGYVYGNLSKTARPKIAIDGHLDTVFDANTLLEVTEKEGRLYCPGIADDTSALAANLSVLRAIKHAGLKPVGTIMLGGTVGEEGEGNARGIRHLIDRHQDIDAVLCVESYDETCVIRTAVGSKRYEFIFRGPGGHSWGDFGLPSPLHAMGRAMAKIADIVTPVKPKTTYTLGTAHGGRSVNSIADEARLKVDMRSVDVDELFKLEQQILALVRLAVTEENDKWQHKEQITLDVVEIGNRPAGEIPLNATIIQAACQATLAIKTEPLMRGPTSTNQNVPASLGIPSVVIGAGGNARDLHSLHESYATTRSWLGAQKALILLFAMAGLEGVTEPLAEPFLQRKTRS